VTECPKCRSGFLCVEHGGKVVDPDEPLPLIGYARVIVDKLAHTIHQRIQDYPGYDDHSKVEQTRRGDTFEVRLLDGDGPTNFIARVTVELDRVENS